MKSRILKYVDDWTTYAVALVSLPLLLYFLLQTGFFYFRDMSYQSAMLGTAWQTGFKEHCRTVPGCLDIKFQSSLTKPSKSASSAQLIGTHIVAQLTVVSGAQGPVLEQMEHYLGESRSRQVDLEVVSLVVSKKKG